MIGFSMITKTSDGLPLCGTTDISSKDQSEDYQLAYKDLKFITKKLSKFPDRCSCTPNSYSIHFTSAVGLTFLVLCESSYPVVLAFSFLDEIQKEFIQAYERHKTVEASLRPYAYIKFDVNIKKIKARYNNPRSLTTKLDLSALSQEIKLRPPHVIHPDEFKYVGGKHASLTSFRTAASSGRHFVSLDLYGWLSVGMNILCSFLNLTRGVSIMNDGHIDSLDSESFQYAVAFFLCFLFFGYQVYLICCPIGMRKPLACATLGSICLCQLYLWEHRTSVQMLFHVTVGCAATFTIFTRQIQEKLPQYNL
ncbi:vesicle-trafficking protein SEC22a-like [Haliotis rufescens]|uniref:vesicle-trafficking protein SEC22a-like n=1 Tax=Haliotis rufescens TaxID=6454 RepID=UPI001EAFD281|nr:vesicle-trafficking protein SEC22a-like [Haliotis rufescens]